MSISSISVLIVFVISFRFVPLMKKLLSSAKRLGVKLFDTSARSFMYKRNKKGPSTDPCGTPHLVVCSVDNSFW